MFILSNLIHQLHKVFLLCRTSRRIQSLIRNSVHTCWLSGWMCDCSTDVFKSRNCGLHKHGNTGEHFTQLVAASDKIKIRKIYIVEFYDAGCFSVNFRPKPPQAKYISCKKNNILSMRFTDLRICISTFRNVFVNTADHVTKSDNRNMSAMIIAWFSWGIPLGIWQSRCQWNIVNTPIKTWIANLSIGDEDNCYQYRIFDRSASIWWMARYHSPRRHSLTDTGRNRYACFL